MIKEAWPDAIIDIQDLAGDGNHYSATITSSTLSKSIQVETANLPIPPLPPRANTFTDIYSSFLNSLTRY